MTNAQSHLCKFDRGRFDELAAILARGLLRLKRNDGEPPRTLDVSGEQSVHDPAVNTAEHANPNPSTGLGINHQGGQQ